MRQKIFILTIGAFLAMLLTSSQAQAWGTYHVGYTHVGYGGVQHYGHTSASGPYGSYSGSHYGSYGAGGSYHAGGVYGAGYGGTSAYHYSGGSTYGGYHYGGMGGVSTYGSAYHAGVYRAW